MSHVRRQLAHSEALLHQRVAMLAVLVYPLFGVAYRISCPDDWDPVLPRIVITAGFAAAALAAAGTDWGRRWISMMLFIVAQALFFWAIAVSVVNGWSTPWVIGVVLCHFCGAYVFTTPRYNLAVHGTMGLGLVIGILLSPFPAEVPGALIMATWLTLTTFNVLALVRRRQTLAQLVQQEAALLRAHEELEQRVRERTHELEREVVERRAAEEAAQAANLTKSRFLATMSHELRTPLNAVIGYSEILQEDLTSMDPMAAQDLGRIRWSALHLLAMINDILDLAKVESGEWMFQYATLDVVGAVDEVVEAAMPLAAAHSNVLTLCVHKGVPPIVTDKSRLTQVLNNLLSNAAKFTANGTITVTVAFDPPTQRVSVAVRDTGTGIPSDQLERIFERFVQIDNSPTREHGGTGLGLALSRELATALGGDLGVVSSPGQGSTFTLRIPVDGSRHPSGATVAQRMSLAPEPPHRIESRLAR